jgi:hypothetical protein
MAMIVMDLSMPRAAVMVLLLFNKLRLACQTSMLNLSSAIKCDQTHVNDCYEFEHIKSYCQA